MIKWLMVKEKRERRWQKGNTASGGIDLKAEFVIGLQVSNLLLPTWQCPQKT